MNEAWDEVMARGSEERKIHLGQTQVSLMIQRCYAEDKYCRKFDQKREKYCLSQCLQSYCSIQANCIVEKKLCRMSHSVT